MILHRVWSQLWRWTQCTVTILQYKSDKDSLCVHIHPYGEIDLELHSEKQHLQRRMLEASLASRLSLPVQWNWIIPTWEAKESLVENLLLLKFKFWILLKSKPMYSIIVTSSWSKFQWFCWTCSKGIEWNSSLEKSN